MRLMHFSTFVCLNMQINKDIIAICFSSIFVSSKTENEGGKTLSERGSVLVFLPGIHEINYMQESLAKLLNKR